VALTVSVQTPIQQYYGNSSATVFTYPFRVISSADLHVYLDGILQSSGYTITGVNNDAGGSVIFSAPPATGVLVVLQRLLTLNRETDFQEAAALPTIVLDNDLDRVTMMIQDTRASQLEIVGGNLLDAKGQRITNLGSPVNAQDAVTKVWVETSASSQVAQATTQAGIATTKASEASASAASALASQTTASAQAAVAITKASESAASAAAALTSQNSASTSATTATNAASTATTQAGIATTKAGEASTSATNAAASEASSAVIYTNVVNALTYGPVISLNGRGGIVVLDKTDVGLGNVNNTSDANKPVSTAQAAAIAVATQAGFRNRVINGQMRVDQRNGGAAVTPSSTALFVTDRWQAGVSQASKLTYQGSVDAPAGFFRSLKISTISAFSPGASDGFQLLQTIEADNLTDFQFGLATAQTVSLSFWVKGTVAGSYSLSICNPTGTRSFVATYAVTTGWTLVKIVVPGDTAGSWPIGGTAAGAVLRFCMGAGTALATATTNAWVAGNFLKATGTLDLVANASATLNVTGVQLELGSTATPFEQVGIGQELLNCQRYFQTAANDVGAFLIWMGNTTAGNAYSARIKFNQVMRASPTVTIILDNQAYFPAAAGTVVGGNSGFQESRTSNSNSVAGFFSSNWTASAEL
jgi:hypothetical protein